MTSIDGPVPLASLSEPIEILAYMLTVDAGNKFHYTPVYPAAVGYRLTQLAQPAFSSVHSSASTNRNSVDSAKSSSFIE